mgnify:FL=1|tara:strand:- start:940 stop:1683 length:744 start_codon:yes stop_codon:yes gene_type:complete
MDTAFIIGNGESRNIFPIENLKGKGVIYGCNAIYRDHPMLCDHIVAVNPPMYEELATWHNNGKESPQIHGLDDISDWNYICDGDNINDVPTGLKIYRIWRGGDVKKGGKIKTNDFSVAKGSGCSAVLLAAESGIENVVIMAFDIMGAQQWEMETPSRIQNNIYKNSINYPGRESMKAYLKYEWMYQLRQTIRRFPKTNFRFINRKEYLEGNPFLKWYFDQPNIKCGIYADLQRWITGHRDDIKWKAL